MTKTIVLVDYENFHVTATRDYNLLVTNKGLTHLFDSWKQHGKIVNEDILVAAFWDYFRNGKDFFRKKFVKIIDAPDNGSNVADGYLIVEGLQHYQRNSEIENVVLVSGDGVNTGLVEFFLRKGSKVFVYSWKKSLSGSLQVNEDVSIHLLDNLFGYDSNQHITQGWFKDLGVSVSPAQYAIICRVLNSKYNDLYFSKTVRDITSNTDDERYKEIDTEDKAKSFLNNCKVEGIFTSEKKLGSKGKDEITVFELNRSNEKVQWVIQQEAERKKIVGKQPAIS